MVLLLILSLGEYGVFDATNDIKTGIIPESEDGDKSVKVYSFSKQVYGESYKPSGKLLNSLDVASYITSQRLGDRQKMGMIVLNNQKKITGHIFLPYTDFANIDDIANDIAYYTSTMGGNAAILFGNIPLSKLEGKGLSDKVKNYSSVVLDYLELEGGRYNSALDRGIRFSVEKDGNIKPIGKGVFGNVYNQFKGKPKEALAFFKKNRQGDLLGVFHRDGVGDIDFVWGDDKSGLSHINNKHVGKSKSFHSLDEAVDHIENIINLGKIAFRNGDKILIKKGDEVVTLRRNVRGNGKKIADKNWILTAYNEKSADSTSAISVVNQGQAAPTTDFSVGKVSEDNFDIQENNKKSFANIENNDYNNEDEVRFSVGDERNLVGVHNLSERDLAHVAKMGGIANPSMAVVNRDIATLDNFGEISLIAPKTLIDKKTGKNVGTWTADAYSPRYPKVDYTFDRKVRDAFKKRIEDAGVTDYDAEALIQEIESNGKRWLVGALGCFISRLQRVFWID